MKKLSISLMALLSMCLVACNGDYDTLVGPQSNLPESQLQTSDVAVATGVQSININDYLSASGADSLLINIGTATVKEGAMPKNTILKAEVQVGSTEDFAKSITVDAESMAETNEISVSPTALQEAYYNTITHNPKAKDVYVRTILYTVTNGASVAIVGEPGKNYFDVHKVNLTPLASKVKIASKYYIVGGPNGWSNSATGAVSIPFEHSDLDVYDDPTFTVVINASFKEDGSRDDTWFSILSGDDVDAFVGGNWNVLIGNTISNGNEELTGMLQPRSEFGGDNNMKMSKEDGAAKYQVTIDLLENTYEIKPLSDGAVVPDPVLFMTGENYGWGSSDDSWVPLVPVWGDSNVSWLIVYLNEGEEFKFSPVRGWSGDFSPVVANDKANSGLTTPNNCKAGKAGWYMLVVNSSTKTMDVYEPNIYLIGDAVGTWDAAQPQFQFTAPTTKDGKFVSPAFTAGKEVRMHVAIDGYDWWKTEFVVNAKGQIDFRGNGGDQARVTVKEGQRCYLNFSNGSGLYK